MKKLIALLLCAIITLLCIPVVAVFASSDGYTAIGTAAEFEALMKDSAKWNGKYRLTADIDLSSIALTPIGTEAIPFTGVFDGSFYRISGITVEGTGIIGLFGSVKNAEIRNLLVSGTVKNLDTSIGMNSGVATGGIIGFATQKCVFENLLSEVAVTGSCNVGGVIGYAFVDYDDFTVRNCINTGKVTGTAVACGGIIGHLQSSGSADHSVIITGCTNNGAVDCTDTEAGIAVTAGGIIGKFYCETPTEITYCVNNGEIIASEKATDAGGIGGIVGRIADKDVAISLLLKGCLNNAKVQGGYYAGGIGGYMNLHNSSMSDSFVEECANYGEISGLRYGAGMIGYLRGQDTTGTYKIYLKNCFNSGKISATNTDASGTTSGGMVGYQVRSELSGCLNLGEVSQPNVSEPVRIGGISGYAYSYSGTSCYSVLLDPYGSMNADNYQADDASRKISYEDAKLQTNFAGFDFNSVWKMGNLSPVLQNVGNNTEIKHAGDTAPVTTPSAQTSESETGEPVPETTVPGGETTPETGSFAVYFAIAGLVSLFAIAGIGLKKRYQK